jgi:signal peptidase I
VVDEQTQKPRSSFWRELPILLGVAVLVAVLVRTFVLQTFFIPSPSMEHTLNIDDRVLVNKLVYDFRSPERGEIVVFRAPIQWSGSPAGQDYIKRVIGVPGDRVRCCDAQRRITINGTPLDEPYIYTENGHRDAAAEEQFDVVVPAGRLWLMGDHRSESGDSLEHWRQTNDIDQATVPEDAVVGRAFTIFWPVDRAGWLPVPTPFETVHGPQG